MTSNVFHMQQNISTELIHDPTNVNKENKISKTYFVVT